MKERIEIALRYFGNWYAGVFFTITASCFLWPEEDRPLFVFLNKIDNLFYFDSINDYAFMEGFMDFPIEVFTILAVVFTTRWIVFGNDHER